MRYHEHNLESSFDFPNPQPWTLMQPLRRSIRAFFSLASTLSTPSPRPLIQTLWWHKTEMQSGLELSHFIHSARPAADPRPPTPSEEATPLPAIISRIIVCEIWSLGSRV